MELAVSALGSLLPKLATLLTDEYILQKGVRGQIRFLQAEMASMQADLNRVSKLPPQQIDDFLNIWATDLRELSYDIEDSVDTLMVQVDAPGSANPHSFIRFFDRTIGLLTTARARHHIADDIQDIKRRVIEVSERRERYNFDVVVQPHTVDIDPRLTALYEDAAKLVGIDGPTQKVVDLLTKGEDVQKDKLMVVSIVGVGGLGKTTIANAAYERLWGQFECQAFVSVSLKPNMKMILGSILRQVSDGKCTDAGEKDLDELIKNIREFLTNKRYFIVVDDIWEIQSWETIKSAIGNDNNSGARIITTTRNLQLAGRADEVYKLPPLSLDSSRELFFSRISRYEGNYVDDESDEISKKILRKCGGLPLAIITMASLLVNKPRDKWFELCDSIGSGLEDNRTMENTMRILSLSYHYLPPHLRPCLLYLCGFPEDFVIKKDILIWKWIAEGFIHERGGKGLFEIGEKCFNDLINTSMIQAIQIKDTDLVYGCRVRSVVLDFIFHTSHEENFVRVLGEEGQIFGLDSRIIRRLVIKNRKEEYSLRDDMVLLPRLRSLTAIGCPMYLIPPVSSFNLLRVLDLESCGSMEGYDHEHLGKLLHLRFLGLRNTFIGRLPEETGRLKFLQTIELEGSGVEELPASIEFARLMCLNADWTTRVPDWIEKLSCLQRLVMYPGCGGDEIEDSITRRFAKGLGNLGELREVRLLIKSQDEGQLRDFLMSLSKLPMIKVIHLDFYGIQLERGFQFEPEGFSLSKSLCFLELPWFKFSSLPSWINAEDLPQLSHLWLMLSDVDERDLENLGAFPNLSHLHLVIVNTDECGDAIITSASGAFMNLKFCSITKPLKFRQGAMPRLEVLDFHFNVRFQRRADRYLNFNFDLEYLTCLQHVIVQINCLDASPEEVSEVEAALKHAVQIHRNRPILDITLCGQKLEKIHKDGANNNISYSDKGKGVEVAEGDSKSAYYAKSLSLARDGIDELIKRLSVVNNEASKKMKIVPIIRSQGLGKTTTSTLAKKVFDNISPQFDCAAFVLVGQNPDMKKVFIDILVGLDKQQYQDFHMTVLDIMDLIGLIRRSLINKRFFVIVDDIQDLEVWNIIKCALIENSNGSAVLITTSHRNWDHLNRKQASDKQSGPGEINNLKFAADKQSGPGSTVEDKLKFDADKQSDSGSTTDDRLKLDADKQSDSSSTADDMLKQADPGSTADDKLKFDAGKQSDDKLKFDDANKQSDPSSTIGDKLKLDEDKQSEPGSIAGDKLKLDADKQQSNPCSTVDEKLKLDVDKQSDPSSTADDKLKLNEDKQSDHGSTDSDKLRLDADKQSEPGSTVDGKLKLDADKQSVPGSTTDEKLKLAADKQSHPDSTAVNRLKSDAGKQSDPGSTANHRYFYKELFESEDRCPEYLKDLCEKLIETCDGIITDVYETVEWFRGVPETLKDWQAAYEKRNLALSYPGLPEGQQKSLLYFSMFRQGYEISADRLVCAWIAQDFVLKTEGGEKDLQEVGKSYLSDLIKRKMIEAVEVDADGMAVSCCANELVHDFIVSKSKEDNFAAILNDSESEDKTLQPEDVHRLSIQRNKSNNTVHYPPQGWLSKVRSLVAACDNLPPVSWFRELQVMDLGGCDSLQASHLKDIKKSSSLRYLAIGGKYIDRVPTEITKLKYLQTLDLSTSDLSELPECVLSLSGLQRLFVNSHMKIPHGITKMSALQELGDINIHYPKLLKKLRQLRKLRVLRIAIWSWDEGSKSSDKLWWDTLISEVGFWKKIDRLCILTFCSLDFMDGSDDKWPSQTLKKLEIRHSAFNNNKLPSWFDSLSNITSLTIEVYKLSQNITDTLGKLSSLCSLFLTSKQVPEPEVYFVVDSPDRFKKLESLKFVSNEMVKLLQRPQANAKQQFTRLTVVFHASRTAHGRNKDFRFGLDKLLSLQHVRVEINCSNASPKMVNNAEAAIGEEISKISRDDGSQPILDIRRLQEESMIAEEDQTTGPAVAQTSSSCAMETMRVQRIGLALMPSVEVVSKVISQNSSNHTFFKNVGILTSSTKIKTLKERALEELTAEKQGLVALHQEVDELKKKFEVTEQALAKTQMEFENFKKRQEEKNLLLEHIMQSNNAGIS